MKIILSKETRFVPVMSHEGVKQYCKITNKDFYHAKTTNSMQEIFHNGKWTHGHVYYDANKEMQDYQDVYFTKYIPQNIDEIAGAGYLPTMILNRSDQAAIKVFELLGDDGFINPVYIDEIDESESYYIDTQDGYEKIIRMAKTL